MAAGSDAQEKTEDATPKRIREARKKGQVSKSRDFTTVFVMIVVFIALALALGFITGELKELMRFTFGLVERPVITGNDMMTAGKLALAVLIKVLAPVFIAGFASAFLVGFLQVGAVFSPEPLKPKLEKLNPVEGLKNMFKVVTLVELVKNIAKLLIVFYLAYSTISSHMQEILLSSQVGVIDAVSLTGEIVYSFFIKVMAVFFAIALADMGVQRWNYLKNMRMSKEEIKREYKEDEGDPQIKGERRRQHREMVFGDVRNNVKKSDAVVSNPIHVAVAVRYARGEMNAPEIAAKGQRRFAEMILAIAREELIPVVRNVPLAWSLVRLEVGDAIPEDLYEPVAEVLSFVYEMKERQKAAEKPVLPEGRTEKPAPASDFNPLG